MGEDPLIEWIAVTIDCGNVGVVAEFWRQLLGLVWLEEPSTRLTASAPGCAAARPPAARR
jgi:hypothetical protein